MALENRAKEALQNGVGWALERRLTPAEVGEAIRLKNDAIRHWRRIHEKDDQPKDFVLLCEPVPVQTESDAQLADLTYGLVCYLSIALDVSRERQFLESKGLSGAERDSMLAVENDLLRASRELTPQEAFSLLRMILRNSLRKLAFWRR